MNSRQLLARLIALRTLRRWARVVGTTPFGEPIVVAEGNRLVMRRGGRSFWISAGCAVCRSEVAKIDLHDHQQTCQGPDPASRARRPPSRPKPRPTGRPKARLIAPGLAVILLAAGGVGLAARTRRTEQPERPGLQTTTSLATGSSAASTPSLRRNEAEQVAFQAEQFSERRSELTVALTEVLADDQSASVDRLEFDPKGPTVQLQVTARSITAQSSRDAAWRLTEAVLRLWEPNLMALVPNAVPSFSLGVNTRRIVCGPDVMIQLGGRRAARELWDERCR